MGNFWGISAGVIALAVGAFACKGQSAGLQEFSSESDLMVTTPPYENASFVAVGTSFPINLQLKKEAQGYRITYLAHGEELGHENYLIADKALLFAGTREETFEPAVPLVRVGSTALTESWSGNYSMGPRKLKAKASITRERESLNTENGKFQTIHIKAVLEIESGGPSNPKRELQFWVAPKSGVVQAELGPDVRRQAAPP